MGIHSIILLLITTCGNSSFEESLEELRKSEQEGVAGDLGIEGVSFDEVFLTVSESTK